MPRVQELRTGLWWWEAEHPEWTPEDAGTEDWGLIPDSINTTIRHRDSHENRIRRGCCVTSIIRASSATYGLRHPQGSREARTTSAVSQVCGQSI